MNPSIDAPTGSSLSASATSIVAGRPSMTATGNDDPKRSVTLSPSSSTSSSAAVTVTYLTWSTNPKVTSFGTE